MKKMVIALFAICFLVGCRRASEPQSQPPTSSQVTSMPAQSTLEEPVPEPSSQGEVSQRDRASSTAKQPVYESRVTDYANSKTTIHFDDGTTYTFQGEKSIEITKLLAGLAYHPGKVCKCLPEYKIDTVVAKGYGVHLTQGYARNGKGQATLTEKQQTTLTQVIQWAKSKRPGVESKETVDPKTVSELIVTKYASPPGPESKAVQNNEMIQAFFTMWNKSTLVKADQQPKPGTTWSVKTNDGSFAASVVNGLLYYQGNYYQLPKSFVPTLSKLFETEN